MRISDWSSDVCSSDLAEHGGGTGVRDEGMLESALARPQQLHAYGDPPPDLADLAASVAFGLARNHPLVDGNKRTAHVCYRVFLALTDADLAASAEEKYVQLPALAQGSQSETDFPAGMPPPFEGPPSGAGPGSP